MLNYSSEILFTLLLLSTLIVPGLAVFLTFSEKSQSDYSAPFIVFGLSYCFFIFSLIFFRYLSESSSIFSIWIFSYLSIACLVILIHLKSCISNIQFKENYRLVFKSPIFIIPSLLFIYQYLIGPYTEIPSDFYQHLSLYQAASYYLDRDQLFRDSSLIKLLLLQKSWAWYNLLAWTSSITKIGIFNLIFITTWITKSIFFISFYYLVKYIYSSFDNDTKNVKYKLVIISSLACIFTFVHKGVNVFSFVRYYEFAPTFLAQVLYFSAVYFTIKLFKSNKTRTNFLCFVLIVIFTFAANIVHRQEALFILTIFVIMAMLTPFFPKSQNIFMGRKKLILLSLSTLTLGIIIFLVSSYLLQKSPNPYWKVWVFKENIWPLPDLAILNLKHQGLGTITLWGVFVYLLFALNFNRYKDNLFLLAGMLSPIVTILNPFFVDFFMRTGHSSTLYRMCFLIPIHIVAADLFYLYFSRLINQIKSSGFKITTSASNLIPVILLVTLIFPIYNRLDNTLINPSRIFTIDNTQKNLSHEHLKDSVVFLQSLNKRYKILTDPVTGYAISALTKHHSRRGKFFADSRYLRFTFDNYDNFPLKKYRGYMLIVNLKDYPDSLTGKISSHWPKNILSGIEKYYTPELITHIERNPKIFNKIWSKNKMSIYLIQ